MSASLHNLLSKRLILISGKGGVGKTTIALALSLLAAKQGKNTLLVEMNSTERVAPYFGLSSIGHGEVALAPHLTGINLNPHQCFEEYVLMTVKFRGIFDLFINNKYVTHFLNAVPGFNELLMTGKIYDLERQKLKKISAKQHYDLIIVDGLATGHGVSAFEVPQIVHDVVKVGPMRSQSENILNLLRDEDRTAFCAVTLPEEMAVVETGELLKTVKEKLKISLGPVFLNRFHQSPFTQSEAKKINPSDKNDAVKPFYLYSDLEMKRAALNEEHGEQLKKLAKGNDIIEVPFLFEPLTRYQDLMALVEMWGEHE
ncbi:AAA family ATPase [bacterium]|nr:AAA family ATPase [bacterium]